jgi:ribose transport system substrate-binding protein
MKGADRMKARIWHLALVILTTIALAAWQPVLLDQGTQAQNEGYVVGYLVPNSAEGQVMFMESFRQYAEELGMEVIDVNADNNVEAQDRQCSDLIAQGVDALVMVPVDSEAIVACVDRATEAGIPVFGIDRQPFSPDTVMTVMSNNYLAGQQGAQCVVDRLTEKYGAPQGIVLEITGDLGTNVAQLRGSGFNDEMANYPDIEVITQPTDWLPETGANVVQNTLAATPDLDAIFWHSDFTGAGVIPAMEEIGFLYPLGEEGHIIVCGIDGDPAALDRIRQGSQDATVNQPLLDFGVLAEFVKRYLDGEELTTGTYELEGAPWSPAQIEESEYGLTMLLSTWLVTQDNVDDPTLWGNQ